MTHGLSPLSDSANGARRRPRHMVECKGARGSAQSCERRHGWGQGEVGARSAGSANEAPTATRAYYAVGLSRRRAARATGGTVGEAGSTVERATGVIGRASPNLSGMSLLLAKRKF